MAYPDAGYISHGGTLFLSSSVSASVSQSWRIHEFTSAATFSLEKDNSNITILIVGGGGSGGFNHAGGGGGGGLRLIQTSSLNAGNYTVTVGAGGTAQTLVLTTALKGGNSTFGTSSAEGGGGGGSRDYDPPGGNGGCGGGGGGAVGIVAGGTGSLGFNGGVNQGGGESAAGGGGGGMGSAGSNGASYSGGNGGAGISIFISGSAKTYSVGGKGGSLNITGTAGGTTPGCGGGGGKGSFGIGTSGVNGIVIVKVLEPLFTKRNVTTDIDTEFSTTAELYTTLKFVETNISSEFSTTGNIVQVKNVSTNISSELSTSEFEFIRIKYSTTSIDTTFAQSSNITIYLTEQVTLSPYSQTGLSHLNAAGTSQVEIRDAENGTDLTSTRIGWWEYPSSLKINTFRRNDRAVVVFELPSNLKYLLSASFKFNTTKTNPVGNAGNCDLYVTKFIGSKKDNFAVADYNKANFSASLAIVGYSSITTGSAVNTLNFQPALIQSGSYVKLGLQSGFDFYGWSPGTSAFDPRVNFTTSSLDITYLRLKYRHEKTVNITGTFSTEADLTMISRNYVSASSDIEFSTTANLTMFGKQPVETDITSEFSTTANLTMLGKQPVETDITSSFSSTSELINTNYSTTDIQVVFSTEDSNIIVTRNVSTSIESTVETSDVILTRLVSSEVTILPVISTDGGELERTVTRDTNISAEFSSYGFISLETLAETTISSEFLTVGNIVEFIPATTDISTEFTTTASSVKQFIHVTNDILITFVTEEIPNLQVRKASTVNIISEFDSSAYFIIEASVVTDIQTGFTTTEFELGRILPQETDIESVIETAGNIHRLVFIDTDIEIEFSCTAEKLVQVKHGTVNSETIFETGTIQIQLISGSTILIISNFITIARINRLFEYIDETDLEEIEILVEEDTCDILVEEDTCDILIEEDYCTINF